MRFFLFGREVARGPGAALNAAGWFLLVLAVLMFSTGCSKSNSAGSPAPSPTLTVSLARDPATTPYNVIVTATLRASNGTPAPGLIVTVSATDGSVGPVTDHGDGTYSATITPTYPSGEVAITVQSTIGGTALQQKRTALILPTVDANWGQPEAVRGAVNTTGYEDGPNISPDGQWLVVTDTSPIDVICCLTGCNGVPVSGHSSFCQTVTGPNSYGPPLRPNFPGAWRIVDSTHVLNTCPKLCLTSDFTATGGEVTSPSSAAFPPVASYLFKRQSDGSFGDPQFIGYDSDGCNPPTGISFDGTPSSTTANLVFDWSDPTVTTHSQIYWSQVTLGVTNVLGTCQCTGTGIVSVNNTATALGLIYAQTNSNPSFRGGVLAWDDEQASPNVMYFAVAAGTLPTATFTPNAGPFPKVAVGNYLAEDHSQPFFQTSTSTLFFRKGLVGIFSSLLAPMGDPSVAGAWGPEIPVMVPEASPTRTGAINAVGQGTIATLPTGKDEMYFVYVMITATGTNANIGVIPRL